MALETEKQRQARWERETLEMTDEELLQVLHGTKYGRRSLVEEEARRRNIWGARRG